MLSPEFDAKIGQIKEKYKGVNHFKLVSLLWVCQSILVARNVCLQKIAEDNAHVSSTDLSREQRYGKLRRFFLTGLTAELLEGIFMVIISLLPDVEQADLVIDRTNWQLGSRKYNFLTLGMLYEGCFIPLVWQELGYKGNSNWEQQIDLIDKLIGYWRLTNRPLPKFCIKADREFIKGKWIVALQKREINYVIRIKENLRYPMWKNGSISHKQVNLATYRRYMKRYKVDKLELVVADEVIANLVVIPNGTKQANVKDKDRFVYLLTNLDDLDLAAQQYRLRWKIECCFKHLKSNGFCLENMNLKQEHQVQLLFGCVVLVYALAIKAGVIITAQKPVKILKYQNYQSPAYSTFTIGIVGIKTLANNLHQLIDTICFFFDHNNLKNNQQMYKKLINSF